LRAFSNGSTFETAEYRESQCKIGGCSYLIRAGRNTEIPVVQTFVLTVPMFPPK
jgi:hypothetical protein